MEARIVRSQPRGINIKMNNTKYKVKIHKLKSNLHFSFEKNRGWCEGDERGGGLLRRMTFTTAHGIAAVCWLTGICFFSCSFNDNDRCFCLLLRISRKLIRIYASTNVELWLTYIVSSQRSILCNIYIYI